MNKIILFALLTVFASGLASAQQSIQEKKQQAEKISTDWDYVYGDGWGDTPAEAEKAAIDNLLSKICMYVESSFTQVDEEKLFNDKAEAQMAMKSIMKTYSTATLNNTQDIHYLDNKSKQYYCMRFMKAEEKDRLFDARRDRMEDYVRQGMRAEAKGRVDNALRYLNWAYMLLHSLQAPGEIKMKIDGEDQLLVNWIPNQMTAILEQVSVGVAAVNEDNSVDMTFLYKGEPAAGLQFTYDNGRTTSAPQDIKDGMGQLRFPPDYPIENVLIVVETSFADAAQADKELEGMIHHFKPLRFKEARKLAGTEGKKLKAEKAATKEFKAMASAEKNNGLESVQGKDYKEYKAIVDQVLGSIRNKSFAPNPDLFTTEGLDMYERLMKYGSATILGNPDPGFFPYGERVVARSVPMTFSFQNNKRSFTEDVTFTFTPDKKIESIAFGLGSAARKDIFEQGGDSWSDDVRLTIATFLENYKTAFALKRLEYIESIFDENAYIIVGHKVEKLTKTGGDNRGFRSEAEYTYSQKSKSEYMDQLKKCFASNEYVNVNFANNDVMKSATGGDLFGIQIKQDYYSEHYGDQGYLYLFVDLNEPDQPVIKIRTWQPERNPALTPQAAKSNPNFGIFGNYSFK